MDMKMTDLFISQLEDEGKRTRRTLERVPAGKDDWKPHAKSMPLGRLAMLVAQMPSWVTLVVDRDELDLAGGNVDTKPLRTSQELIGAMEDGVQKGRASLAATNEAHLMKPWRLVMGGKTVMESPRHVVLRDTFSHLAHHRAQLGVYLRLNDIVVPSVYGPSADDQSFA